MAHATRSNNASDASEERFVYPGANIEEEEELQFKYPGAADDDDGDDDEPFVYPGASTAAVAETNEPVAPPIAAAAQPTPAQLEALYASASSGDLELVQTLFQKAVFEYDIEPFALANDAGPRTGLTALHGAASRGHLNVVRWRTCIASQTCFN